MVKDYLLPRKTPNPKPQTPNPKPNPKFPFSVSGENLLLEVWSEFFFVGSKKLSFTISNKRTHSWFITLALPLQYKIISFPHKMVKDYLLPQKTPNPNPKMPKEWPLNQISVSLQFASLQVLLSVQKSCVYWPVFDSLAPQFVSLQLFLHVIYTHEPLSFTQQFGALVLLMKQKSNATIILAQLGIIKLWGLGFGSM